MFGRRCFFTAVALAAFLPSPQAGRAQQSAVTADQIIANYRKAVGADKFPTIKTFIAKSSLFGNVTNFWRGARLASQPQTQEQGTIEFYFKSPNLNYSLSLTENNVTFETHGCDGKVSWSIDSQLHRTEFKPKPDKEGFCQQGFAPAPMPPVGPKVRLRLAGEKKIGDRMAWEIKVDDSKTPMPEAYYFDAESYLLMRVGVLGSGGSVTYSNYRDVGGIKIPFTVVQQFENSHLITTVRLVKIDLPLEDAWFAEPTPVANRILSIPLRSVDTEPTGSSVQPTQARVESTTVSVPDAHIPNFASCSLAELQETVPDLKHFEVAQDQSQLPALLEKIGAKTVEIVRKTPDLISDEAVVSERGLVKTRQNFSYLVLAHAEGSNLSVFDEYRVDLKSGDKLQTEDLRQAATANSLRPSSSPPEPPPANRHLPKSGARPITEGFVNEWLYFYPLNQRESQFRYLGQQKIDGHLTLVVAFAQKPASVPIPVIFRFEGQTFPIFMQGIAWVDASDFRIVRLRTDLLSLPSGALLRGLTADIQFSEVRIAELAVPLWLPHAVQVHSNVGGLNLRESHKYSNYRLFRARSKVLLNP